MTATEDAAAFTTANLAQYEAVVFLNTTGDVLNDTQQTAFESYIRGGGGYVGVHAAADTEYGWPFYGDARRRLVRLPPGDPAGDVKVEDRAHPATGAPAADLDPHRRVVQLPDQPAHQRPRPGHPGRVVLHRRHHGRRPPDHLVQDDRQRPVLLHRPRAHPGVLRRDGASARSCSAASGTRRSGPRPTAGPRAATPRSTTAPPPAGRSPARAASPTATRTLTSVRRHGPLWYSAKQYTLVLAEGRLAADRRQQLRHLRRLPRTPAPTRGSPSTRATRSRSTRPTPPTAPPAPSTAFKSADIAARDAALNPPGEWNTYELLVEGQRIRVYLNGSADQRLHQHRPGPQPRRVHRHPEPRHRRHGRRSATSGSRSSARPPAT